MDDLFNTYKKELTRLGVKYRLTTDQQRYILKYFFEDLKLMVTDPRMPKVIITGFGTFYPSIGEINRSLKKMFFWRRMGNNNKDRLIERIKYLWPIRRRIQEEKQKVRTYSKWHKKSGYPQKK